MPQESSTRDSGGSAQITVSRDSPEDVQTRQIIISLDGERKAELLFGDVITFSASTGHHVLRADNTWNHQDIDLQVVSGVDLHFIAKSAAGQFSRFLLVAFGAGPIYVSIEEVQPRTGR
jgi:hypothetical protein